MSAAGGKRTLGAFKRRDEPDHVNHADYLHEYRDLLLVAAEEMPPGQLDGPRGQHSREEGEADCLLAGRSWRICGPPLLPTPNEYHRSNDKAYRNESPSHPIKAHEHLLGNMRRVRMSAMGGTQTLNRPLGFSFPPTTAPNPTERQDRRCLLLSGGTLLTILGADGECGRRSSGPRARCAGR
jgi:hypothetical protein